jgi:hypothetical protein
MAELHAELAEGAGFELSVPLAKESRLRPLIRRKLLTTTHPHFRMGSIPYAPPHLIKNAPDPVKRPPR